MIGGENKSGDRRVSSLKGRTIQGESCRLNGYSAAFVEKRMNVFWLRLITLFFKY